MRGRIIVSIRFDSIRLVRIQIQQICLVKDGWHIPLQIRSGSTGIVHGLIRHEQQEGRGDIGQDGIEIQGQVNASLDGVQGHAGEDDTVDNLLEGAIAGAVGDAMHGHDGEEGADVGNEAANNGDAGDESSQERHDAQGSRRGQEGRGQLDRGRVEAGLGSARGADVVAHGVSRDEGGQDGALEGSIGADHASDEEVGGGHGGDIALRQLVLVGEGRADDGGKLQEDAEGPDVVAPEEVWIYVDT